MQLALQAILSHHPLCSSNNYLRDHGEGNWGDGSEIMPISGRCQAVIISWTVMQNWKFWK